MGISPSVPSLISPRMLTSILVGLTIALFASGIFLGEGWICILMAAPIFYGVGLIIGKVIDSIRQDSGERSHNRLPSLILLPFLLMSLEGTHESLSFPREETVVVEKVVPASPRDVEASWARCLTSTRNYLSSCVSVSQPPSPAAAVV